jgi:hypothetical protein
MALICQCQDISFKYVTDLKRAFVPTYFTYLNNNILLPTYSLLCVWFAFDVSIKFISFIALDPYFLHVASFGTHVSNETR